MMGIQGKKKRRKNSRNTKKERNIVKTQRKKEGKKYSRNTKKERKKLYGKRKKEEEERPYTKIVEKVLDGKIGKHKENETRSKKQD